MRKLLIISMFLMLANTLLAQKKIAVFEPKDDSQEELGGVVLEIFSSIITISSDYISIGQDVVNKNISENKSQSSELDEVSKLCEMGKQMGADYICTSGLKKIGENYFITAKLLNVEKSVVENQKYIKTENKDNDLVEKAEELIAGLLNIDLPKKEKQKEEEKDEADIPIIEIDGRTYMVMPTDILGEYTWSGAMRVCEELKALGYKDWYLPSKTEMKAIYLNKDNIGGFGTDTYWTRNYNSMNGDYSYWQDFSNGKMDCSPNSTGLHVRCVRLK